jgi:diguanylate cyclase (GGDEF)-like protein
MSDTSTSTRSRLINLSTDVPALLVIALGVAIAVLLNDLAVKLIGLCIAVLGVVALFVLIAQRAKPLPDHTAQENAENAALPDETDVLRMSDTSLPVAQYQSTLTTEHNAAHQHNRANAKSPAPSSSSSGLAFGDDDIPDIPTEPLPQPASALSSSVPSALPSLVQSPTAPAFTFDDDSDADFSALESQLTLAPDKYVPQERPPKEPTTETTTLNAVPQAQASAQTPHPARPAAFTFDDVSESGVQHGTFVPEIPMVESEPPPIIKPKPGMELPTPSAEELNEPIPTPPFDAGVSFGDDDESVRVVGTSTNTSHAASKDVKKKTVHEARTDAASLAAITHEEPTEEHISARIHAAERMNISATHSHAHEGTLPEQVAAQAAQAAHSAQPVPPPTAAASTTAQFTRKALTVAKAEIMEHAPDLIKKEPRKEFDYLLQRVLMVIRSAMNVRTAAFVWANVERSHCIMETRISDVPEVVQKNTIMPFGEDILTQIIKAGNPEILADISTSAELALLPYYTGNAGIQSFVGVPVFSSDVVVGVLLADSTDKDAFSAATISFLGQFTKLISGLIQGYNEKYDLLQSARTLEALETFRSLTARYDNAPEDICTALLESVMRLIPYNTVGTVMFSDKRGDWYVSDARSKESNAIVGSAVYIDNSLIGKAITSGKTLQTSKTHNVIRVTPTETKYSPSTLSAFVAVPLVSSSRCYGALFVEESGSVRLTKQDIELLETTAEYAGSALEQMQLKEFLHQHTLVDDATEILNKAGFLQRVSEEFVRASDVQLAFSVVLIGIDQYASFGKNSAQFTEALIMHIAHIARKNLRVYDIIGRYSDTVIAVGMIEKNTQDCQLWAEKVRRSIAAEMLTVGGKQYAVTVSIGIAEFLKQKSLAELLANVEKAFAIAREKSNAVSMFS